MFDTVLHVSKRSVACSADNSPKNLCQVIMINTGVIYACAKLNKMFSTGRTGAAIPI